MNAIKAPKGGLVSPVNGQFYNGGEFVPDHGLYCGKGKNRVTMVAFDDIADRLMSAKGWTLRYNENLDTFQAVLPTGNVMVAYKNIKTFAAFCK